MRGSERNADSTPTASSGLSKASEAVLFDAIASLSVRTCCRLDLRIWCSSPARNNEAVISNAMPQVVSVIALSLRRMGTAPDINRPPRQSLPRVAAVSN